MVNGIINVYKEKGYTSFDVVAKLRGILKQKKIGHTGTLDPDAQGVLPVCLGKATKVCDLLTDKNKEYKAVMLLGKVTDTQDMSGTVLQEREVCVSEQEVRDAVLSFVGGYEQVPPMYSALKVNGKKLCDLAREGKTVERKARPVQILSIEIEKIELPRVTMKVECSKGTYIRTLCQDIGEKLGCGACMERLLRTKVSKFIVEDALTLGQIEELVAKEGVGMEPAEWSAKTFSFIQPVDSVFLQYPKAVVLQNYDKVLYNGNRLEKNFFRNYQSEWEETPIRIYDEKDCFVGLYEYKPVQKNYKPAKMFIET